MLAQAPARKHERSALATLRAQGVAFLREESKNKSTGLLSLSLLQGAADAAGQGQERFRP